MIKLIVWDLDGILWKGALAEEGIQEVNYEAVEFIKDTESKGIIHSVCSKNNFAEAKQQLENLGLFNLFVFPTIDLTSKGLRVKEIIENCQLRPANVLFVDDNIVNTNEAIYYIPELVVHNNLDFIKTFAFEPSKSRTEQYKILEKKTIDKTNINFLQDSNIRITITNDNECILFHDRIIELVNRSNTLNFTKSRMTVDFSDKNITPYYHFNVPRRNYAVFAWDKYGYYGLVGYFSSWDGINVEHFVFSCRILNMGIENFCSKYIQEKLGWKQNYLIDTSQNYDYIKLEEFRHCKRFIETNEQIAGADIIPVGNINAGACHSYIIWALTGISNKLTYENYTLESIDDDFIRRSPKLHIFSVFTEMDIDNFTIQTQQHMIDCVKKYNDLIKKYDKKVLLLIPKIEYDIDPLLKFLHQELASIVDDDHFVAYQITPSTKDFRHYNRKSLYDISQFIKYWVESHLQNYNVEV